eukprot:SAG31_NODE_73_length_27793_cov_26.900520_25_plen_145_part_00
MEREGRSNLLAREEQLKATASGHRTPPALRTKSAVLRANNHSAEEIEAATRRKRAELRAKAKLHVAQATKSKQGKGAAPGQDSRPVTPERRTSRAAQDLNAAPPDDPSSLGPSPPPSPPSSPADDEELHPKTIEPDVFYILYDQ